MTNKGPMPAIEYAPAPCPRCGATTYEQAGDICRPGQDFSGDYWCPGGEEDVHAEDDLIRQPTAESIALQSAWYNRAGDGDDALFGDQGETK